MIDISKEIELKNMMAISNSFFKVSGIDLKDTSEIDVIELIAVTVNCAFSTEVALKFLYYANNNSKITGHNISDIYKSTKKYGLEEFLLKKFFRNEIDKILKEMGNSFTEFRYLYEQEKILYITPGLMKDFTRSVNEYCNYYLDKLLKKE